VHVIFSHWIWKEPARIERIHVLAIGRREGPPCGPRGASIGQLPCGAAFRRSLAALPHRHEVLVRP
jgi:hypothetical protein